MKFQQIRFPPEYRLPTTIFEDTRLNLMRAIEQALTVAGASAIDAPSPEELEKELSEVAVQLWRLGNRLVDPKTGEPTEETRIAHRRLEAARDSLKVLGVEVRDYTFQEIAEHGVTGLRILAEEPRADLDRRTVIETVKPAIFYRGSQVEMSEVIVGIPLAPNDPEPK